MQRKAPAISNTWKLASVGVLAAGVLVAVAIFVVPRLRSDGDIPVAIHDDAGVARDLSGEVADRTPPAESDLAGTTSSGGEAASSDDTAAVLACFNSYKQSLLAQDGARAVGYVDSRTIEHYNRMLKLALTAEASTVRSLSSIDKWIVLSIRHQIPVHAARSMTGESFFVHAVDEGWFGGSSVLDTGVRDVVVSGDSAVASAMQVSTGRPALGQFRFQREAGEWRVDLTSAMPAADQALKQLISRSGQPEDAYLLSVLESLYGGEVSEALWDPIDRGTPSTTVLVNSLGNCQLTLPEGWVEDAKLSGDADLKASDRFNEAYVIILTEGKTDGDTIEAYSELTRGFLIEGLDSPQTRRAERLRIGDQPALQVEIAGTHKEKNLDIVYVHAIVEGPDNFYQIITWTIPSHYERNRPTFEQLIGSFRRVVDRPEADARASSDPYLARRSAFTTKLIRNGPSPQQPTNEPPPAGVREITYPSGALKLRAWLHVPEVERGEKRPALVYFHGGFALASGDFQDCQPFVDSGFVVMAPMLRGENGNPGDFELFLGEVDDAKAAVHWLARQPYVDVDQIYTFGHSSGGAISALLSLLEDVPVEHGGSSGGLYDRSVFDAWSEFVPFDATDPSERDMRLLLGNIRWMQREHHAYIGEDDTLIVHAEAAKGEMGGDVSSLQIHTVPGDHFSSLAPSLRMYLDVITKEIGNSE